MNWANSKYLRNIFALQLVTKSCLTKPKKMLPIQRIKIKDNLTKSLGDIFSPCDTFCGCNPISALTPCLDLGQRFSVLEKVGSWWETDSQHRYREYLLCQCTPLSTLSQVQSWLVSPETGDGVSAYQDTSRHQAPVIRTIHKNPCSLCSQWQEKTLWSWNVSDFIGHFSELLDTLLSVFPCLWVTECLISRLD